MPSIKRRQLLQFAGSTLATIGLSQLDIMERGAHYAHVLAQSTPRKLALLLGINNYQDVPLNGCITDVELQRQLLIHRFGFNPKDILILTDAQATRQGILTGFEEHLVKQARSGDVVVFHFSGQVTLVPDPQPNHSDNLMGSLVPVDTLLKQESSDKYITKSVLDRLLRALQTENVTVVLDTSDAGSFAGSKGFAKGVLLAGAKRDQLAADSLFSDFFSGAFTYSLTQYLWQQTRRESFAVVMSNVSRNTRRLSFTGQEPELFVQLGSGYESHPVYFIDLKTPPAVGTISKVESNRVEFWLCGLNPRTLTALEQGAIFAIVDAEGREQGEVQLESRKGLIGQGILLEIEPSAVQKPGPFLQERVRTILRDLKLRIGLDPSLGNSLAQTKQALEAINHIEVSPLQQGRVDYILARMTDAYHQKLKERQLANLPSVGTIGLFLPGLELVSNSFGSPGETISNAINRLNSRFRSLLAIRIFKLLPDSNSSQLNVSSSISLQQGENKGLISAFTDRASADISSEFNELSKGGLGPGSKIPLGNSIQLKITNNEPSKLYFVVLAIDSTGGIAVIFPNSWRASEDDILVQAEQTLRIPDFSIDSFKIVIASPPGVTQGVTTEFLIVASTTPLRRTLLTLRELAASKTQRIFKGNPRFKRTGQSKLSSFVFDSVTVREKQSEPISPTVDPLQLIGSFLDDFDEGNRGLSSNSQSSTVPVDSVGEIDRINAARVARIDTRQVAVISMIIEGIPLISPANALSR